MVAMTERHSGPGDNTSQRPIRDLPPVTEREMAARRRGLASAYIEGGDDPELERTLRRERRYVRLLVAMVLVIVVGSLLVSIVNLVITGTGGASPTP